MDEDDEGSINVINLELDAIIGFDGSIIRGFVVHPDGEHIVYPLGNKIIIQNWNSKTQSFLSGHTNTISAVDVSKSGKYIASGQINHIGFKSRVIIWDFNTQTVHSQHDFHKVRVESIVFTKDEHYCLSLGGKDCGLLVVWDIKKKQVLCGSTIPSSSQRYATALFCFNQIGTRFISAGDNHLAIWKIDEEARKIQSGNINTSKIKRNVLCIGADEKDEFCYCGTATGDILKIRLNLESDKPPNIVGCLAKIGKKMGSSRENYELYSSGVRSVIVLSENMLVVGTGNGIVELIKETKSKALKPVAFGVKVPCSSTLQVQKSTCVEATVTSMQLMHQDSILVGTVESEIFSIDLVTFCAKLLITCHTSTIYDIAFPPNFSSVFATAGKNDVRIWSSSKVQELLRIKVPHFSCSSVAFAYDGKSILTAWNDGIIRSFTPLTGRLIYAILNAHNKGVSVIATTHKGDVLVSGGCEGQVRLWKVDPYRQQLLCTLKEHKGPVSSIHINSTNEEAVSSSTDGSCIIWDLVKQCRRQILFSNTIFMCARYHPSNVQILTGGSDKKLAYWEILDGSLVREINATVFGAVNAVDISLDGSIFVTGGNDQLVKLWNYHEGMKTHIGVGHSSFVTAARFSPNGKYIISASASGSIIIWRNPFEGTGSKEEECKFNVEVEKRKLIPRECRKIESVQDF